MEYSIPGIRAPNFNFKFQPVLIKGSARETSAWGESYQDPCFILDNYTLRKRYFFIRSLGDSSTIAF